jgi:protease YdgD
MLYYVLAASENLGEAIRNLARYLAVSNESLRLDVSERAKSTVLTVHYKIPRHTDRLFLEYGYAVVLRAYGRLPPATKIEVRQLRRRVFSDNSLRTCKQLNRVQANAMIETDDGQRCAASASFTRGAILASVLIGAIPALMVSISVADHIASEPHREIVDINTYPWSSIGKVGALGRVCTGAVVGVNQFLTAAHCIYNTMTGRFLAAGSIHFLLGYIKGEYRVHRVGSRYMVPPTFVTSKRDDWAVVYIDERFPQDVKPLRLATETPWPGTAVKTGGYPAERLHVMTADKHCRIKAVSADRKLIAHDCVLHHGDSGGPLLSANEDEEGLIFGVNSLGYHPLVELKEQSKEGGVAVGAASITEFLASQTTEER